MKSEHQDRKVEASAGIALLACAAVALAWANSPWKAGYERLCHQPIGIRVGAQIFERDLHFWINDGLMVLFFFVVGLEIRREIHDGELSSARRAALPVFAAFGGMLVPALVYLGLNPAGAAQKGWGIPTATDIAFALGVLALLGRRVPAALRVLLLGLAIIDDIGAILIVAIFYSAGVKAGGLAIAAAGVLGILLLQRFGVARPIVYALPALLIWAGMLHSGVHPAIGGVIVGLLTPVRPSLDGPAESPSPAARLERSLHPWVAYAIMPLFALANAGVTLNLERYGGDSEAIALGIVLGLALGKPLGIVLVSLIAVRLGICALPRGVGIKQLIVVGAIAGIGFTMSLFVSDLAFVDSPLLGVAKLAVLLGSGLSAALGLGLGWLLLEPGGEIASAAASSVEASNQA